MKKPDDTSKKLIKNIVSLVTSALILVAASFAWFQQDGKVSVESMSGKFEPTFSVSYAKATLNPDDVLWDFNDDSMLYIRSGEEDVTIPDYISSLATSGTWVSMDGSVAENEVLYPGEFRVYRLSFVSFNTQNYKLKIKVPASVQANQIVTKTVCMSGCIRTIDKDTGVEAIESIAKPMNEILAGATGTEVTGEIVGKTIPVGTAADAYYIVGIPGVDFNGTHDTIRETGASFTINAIEVV